MGQWGRLLSTEAARERKVVSKQGARALVTLLVKSWPHPLSHPTPEASPPVISCASLRGLPSRAPRARAKLQGAAAYRRLAEVAYTDSAPLGVFQPCAAYAAWHVRG
jgi:hypothetical protein